MIRTVQIVLACSVLCFGFGVIYLDDFGINDSVQARNGNWLYCKYGRKDSRGHIGIIKHIDPKTNDTTVFNSSFIDDEVSPEGLEDSVKLPIGTFRFIPAYGDYKLSNRKIGWVEAKDVLYPAIKLFNDFDSSTSSRYALIGIYHNEDYEEDSASDSIGSFFTTDFSVLQSFKDAWTFSGSAPRVFCGRVYELFLMVDGTLKMEAQAFIDCGTLYTQKYDVLALDFHEKMRMVKGDLKKPWKAVKWFENITSARSYLDSIKELDGFLGAKPFDWQNFEGEFVFRTRRNFLKNNYRTDNDNIIKNSIQSFFPDSYFVLKSSVSGYKYEDFRILCSKTLFEKWDLYPIVSKWEPYDTVYVESYWDSERNVENIKELK